MRVAKNDPSIMLRPMVPRLSRVWLPSGGIAAVQGEDGHAKLIRAGFLRPAQPGIFHMLPLGRRVQEKIEKLIVRHMEDELGMMSSAAERSSNMVTMLRFKYCRCFKG